MDSIASQSGIWRQQHLEHAAAADLRLDFEGVLEPVREALDDCQSQSEASLLRIGVDTFLVERCKDLAQRFRRDTRALVPYFYAPAARATTCRDEHSASRVFDGIADEILQHA